MGAKELDDHLTAIPVTALHTGVAVMGTALFCGHISHSQGAEHDKFRTPEMN